MSIFDNTTFRMIVGQKWVTRYNSFLALLDSLWDTKADSDHTHGAAGTVITKGATAERTAVTDGSLHFNTEREQLEMLDASGNNVADITRADEAVIRSMFF